MPSKVTVVGNYLEIKEYEKEIRRVKVYRRRKAVLQSSARLSIRSESSLKRKKQNFIRLVRSNLVGSDSPSLFTLTMFEVLSVESSYKALGVFMRRLRKRFKKNFRYIAVLEFQERGAVHFHVMIWGLPINSILNERSNRFYQSLWQRGFVDCISTDGQIKLAGYLAKYLSKSMSDERLHNQKAYRASGNILRPVLLPFNSTIGYVQEVWGIDLLTSTPCFDVEYDTEWLGKGRFRIYKFI